MNTRSRVFDLPHAMALAVAKAESLRSWLPPLVEKIGLQTALDMGCGLGYFSEFLRDLGLTVVGVDVRQENIEEAQRRYPKVRFRVGDVEDPSLSDLGVFDIVLCLGLLYHLENPFRAIRNLHEATGKICVIETMVAPHRSPLTAFVEEGEGEDQGRNYLAQIPSEAWLLKVLSKAGFLFIYRPSPLPHHADFRSFVHRKKRRTVLVASKLGLVSPSLEPVVAPQGTGRFMWYTFGLGKILEQAPVRNVLKVGTRALKKRA